MFIKGEKRKFYYKRGMKWNSSLSQTKENVIFSNIFCTKWEKGVYFNIKEEECVIRYSFLRKIKFTLIFI
jgi:hypothetical protein